MGRRRAAGPETLGRALIRQKTQRSRNPRHGDVWVRQSLSCFVAFFSSYESLDAAKPRGRKSQENFVGKTAPQEGSERGVCVSSPPADKQAQGPEVEAGKDG